MKKRSDEQIKHDVQSELLWDTRLWNLKIKVLVENGVVTLLGTAPSYLQKLAAQEAAHHVKGVLDVANEVTVNVRKEKTDEEIARAVRTALEWNALVHHEKIKTSVSDGSVTLEGSVNSMRECLDVEEVVEKLTGVTRVINNLEVQPAASASSAASTFEGQNLRDEIEAALERRATREAERFQIELKDGVVNLRGRVHSWQEHRAVVGALSHAPGVRKVNDHLRIDPYF